MEKPCFFQEKRGPWPSGKKENSAGKKKKSKKKALKTEGAPSAKRMGKGTGGGYSKKPLEKQYARQGASFARMKRTDNHRVWNRRALGTTVKKAERERAFRNQRRKRIPRSRGTAKKRKWKREKPTPGDKSKAPPRIKGNIKTSKSRGKERRKTCLALVSV